MNSLVLCVLVYVGFIVAYRTYGRFLGAKLFELNKDAMTPACEFDDGIDYAPAKKEILSATILLPSRERGQSSGPRSASSGDGRPPSSGCLSAPS